MKRSAAAEAEPIFSAEQHERALNRFLKGDPAETVALRQAVRQLCDDRRRLDWIERELGTDDASALLLWVSGGRIWMRAWRDPQRLHHARTLRGSIDFAINEGGAR